MGLPAASGWTEQKKGWELRPERQRGQVLDDIVVGFGSDSQRADTGAERLEARGCRAPAAGGGSWHWVQPQAVCLSGHPEPPGWSHALEDRQH